MGKVHYAGCDRAHEGDNMDYWSDKTACGLDVDNDAILVEDRAILVTCKKCLKILIPIGETPEEGKEGIV